MQLASLEIKIARSENLQVLPQVVSSVLKIADDPNSTQRDMERVIERDSAITGKILKVANSPFYAQNGVATIGRAISLLGMNTMKSLVLGLSYQQISNAKPQAPSFSKLEYWKHCLAVGTAARILGMLRMVDKAEELFGGGMMHDIGLLVLDRFAPNELEQAIYHARENQIPLYQAEQVLYGWTHADVGNLLAEKWGLTGFLKNLIKYHHEPSLDTETYEATCIISIADTLAHQCGYGNNMDEIEYQIDESLAEAVDLPIGQFDAIKEVVMREVQKTQDTFNIR